MTGGKKMDAKVPVIIGLVVAFGIGILVGGFYQSGKAPEWGRAYTVSEAVGIEVRSPQGEDFGKITDYVIDTNGRIPFAVLMHGEKPIAVPFGALTYNTEGKDLVLNLSKEKLDSAPVFDKSALANRTWVEETYHYFGQAPYWTDHEAMNEQRSTAEPATPAPASEESR
jgi:hypothetical protein